MIALNRPKKKGSGPQQFGEALPFSGNLVPKSVVRKGIRNSSILIAESAAKVKMQGLDSFLASY
jgi:hypothetical protein